MTIKNLKKTKKEQVLDAIARIQYEHRYDAGAMFGTLTSSEAESAYKTLSNNLSQFPGLSTEEIEELKTEIETRIASIPQVEQEKEKEYQEYEDQVNTAFEAAKQRFKQLGLFERIKVAARRESPRYQDPSEMSLRQINNLYPSKKTRER